MLSRNRLDSLLGHEEFGLSDWQAITVGGIVTASGWVGFLDMEAYLFAFLLVLTTPWHPEGRWLLTSRLPQ